MMRFSKVMISFLFLTRCIYKVNVVHIEFEAAYIRIISARRADPQEEQIYVV